MVEAAASWFEEADGSWIPSFFNFIIKLGLSQKNTCGRDPLKIYLNFLKLSFLK